MPSIQEIRAQYPQYNDLSDDQLTGALHRKFYADMPYDQFAAKIGYSKAPQSQFEERKQQFKNIDKAYQGGDINRLSVGIQKTGTLAGAAGDIIGNAIAVPFKAADAILPEAVTEPIKRGASSLAENVIESAPVQTAIEKYGNFKQEHPEAAGNVEALANIASIVTPIKGKSAAQVSLDATGQTLKAGAKVTAKTAKKTADYVSDSARILKEGVSARTSEELAASMQAIKESSGQAFKQFREAGAVINKNRGVNIVKQMQTAMAQSGKLNERLHGDSISVVNELMNVAKKGDLSLEELHQYRQLLSDVVNKNTEAIKGMNPDGLKASRAIDTLDDAIESLAKIDIKGGKIEAVDALKLGMDEWKRYRKFESVANIIKQSDGDPNRLKAGLQRFVNKPKNLRGFTNEEKIALKRAAKNSAPELLLKAFGKFGFDLGGAMTAGNTALPTLAVGGGLAGIPGGVPMAVIGTGARQAQKWVGRGKAEDVLKLIESDKNP